MSDPAEDKLSPADLLARADALMRKNRAAPADDDLPILEEEVIMPDVTPEVMRAVADWDGVCESVYSRVMQQLDLYAEFGLKDRVRRELKPKLNEWVDRLADDLSAELSDNIRRYVAQAVDEEVARMRAQRKDELK
jgi:hypothetical protein